MRRLIVLRPEPGASETVERAQAIGLDAQAMPLFTVEPVEWQAPDAAPFDGLLLTSANAIRYGGEQLNDLRGLPAHAVGEATAAAAREAGFDVRSVGDSGVERLLASIAPELRLLHLCGQHRTDVDARQDIEPLPVYRSGELPMPDGLEGAAGCTIALHSPRAGRRFAELCSEARLDRSSIRLAAISEAALAAAGSGWERAKAADRPSDEALLAVAARLCEKPSP